MTEYKLLINPFAEADLIDTKEWYDLQKENLGLEFVNEVKKTIFRIQENPLQFPVIRAKIRKALVKRFPFSIFFYIDETVINVFAVFHTHRNPIIWKKRFNK